MTVKRLEALLPEQVQAAMPGVHAWVSASAGTGKTQVLSARVLRLLLSGVQAANILCITFTKLAAAEMQERVLGRLALWARADDAVLAQEVMALGEPVNDAVLVRARRLFALLLDSPQGLAVQTIHAFSQSLIGSFPVEAGVAPGFQTLDDRAAQALRRDLLRAAIEAATRMVDAAFLDDIATLSLNGGESRVLKALQSLGRHVDALIGLGEAAVEPMLRRGFGLATDETVDTAMARGLAAIDTVAVRRLARGWAQAGNKTALTSADLAAVWLADNGDFESLRVLFLTQKNEVRAQSAVPVAAERGDPGLREVFGEVSEAVLAIAKVQSLHKVIALVGAQLRVMRRLARAWVAAKAEAGVIDYDDMIQAARRLLATPGAADWVRWKLDQRIDHILVDEAQDTNLAQWEIIEALSEEFFAGLGARESERRLFVVGDYKQAIFGFQGSDPKVYDGRKVHFSALADDAGSSLQVIDLAQNFRSVPAVLDVVDAVASALAAVGQGLSPDGVPPHRPHRREAAGAVVLLPPSETSSDSLVDDEEQSDNDTDGERLGQAEIDHAQALAQTIARWLNAHNPLMLPGRGRPVAPQDVLVLVRRRTAFSAALVAALHGYGVPVAGVDRLKLSEPLAVADLLALVRFAVLPDDDLTLACLLVSPFCGLNHDQLFALAYGRDGSLWAAMRASEEPIVAVARDWLLAVLGFADFAAPYEFLERVLSGTLQGRAKLLGRLGEEARDAIETMLDQALAFETLNAPSLQGFLAWVEAEDIEIKRDPDAPLDAVRLMTVHGAKGLQAPVVILADTTHAPNLRANGPLLMDFDGITLPIEPGGTKGVEGPLADAVAAAQADALAEHWRLLYVALTRAEDLLFIAGAKPKKALDVQSWHAFVEAAMTLIGAVAEEDPHHGGTVLVHRSGVPAPPAPLPLKPASAHIDLPDWVRAMAPAEARPPRPLTPSALAPDLIVDPPAGPSAAAAARRGSALHALFERLPGVAPALRRGLGEAWAGRLLPGDDAATLVDEVLAVLDDPAFASVFADHALAEAPIAALVGDMVITGQVDRLLIEDDKVTIVDFKTSRRVPGDASAVPPAHVAQMAGYVAAVRRVFPTREISAALLYTAGPRLIALPPDLLATRAGTALLHDGVDELNAAASVTILFSD